MNLRLLVKQRINVHAIQPLSLPCFSVRIKHKISKNMNSVQQQREHHH